MVEVIQLKLVLACLLATAAAAGVSKKSCHDFSWNTFVDKTTGQRVCTGSYCAGQFFDETLGYERRVENKDQMTLEDNKAACAHIGARMCTYNEIAADGAVSSACYHESKVVWTGESCEQGGVVTAEYNIVESFRNINRRCRTPEHGTKHYGQCCVDFTGSEKAAREEEAPTPAPASASTRTANSCFKLGWTRTLTWDRTPKRVCGASFCGGHLTDKTARAYDETKMDAMSLADAEKVCAAAGARMCTADEVVGDQPHGNNCWSSRTRVWSSTPCDGGYLAVWTTKSTPTEVWTKQCSNPASKLNVRCCASTVAKGAEKSDDDNKPIANKKCEVGKFHTGEGSIVPCAHCPAGKFGAESVDGTAECRGCGFGYHQRFFGKTQCERCALGRFANRERTHCFEAMSSYTDNFECPDAGKFKDAKTGTCQQCAAGHYGWRSTYSLDAECRECPDGKYQGARGASSCAACAAGKYSSSKRVVCSSVRPGDCPLGSFHREGDPEEARCEPCPIGTFGQKDMHGIGHCAQCEEGKYNQRQGEAACKQCEQGKYSTDARERCTTTVPGCKPGTYKVGSYCHKCPVGKFGSMKMIEEFSNAESGTMVMSKTETACYGCEPGSYTNEPGATECKACGLHMFSTHDNTSCTSRRHCKNGPTAVKDGWRGPGWGANYCNYCKCRDGKLRCQKKHCHGMRAKKECSHTQCEMKKSVSDTTGQIHSVLHVKHRHEEKHGDSLTCGYSTWLNRCRCLCDN